MQVSHVFWEISCLSGERKNQTQTALLSTGENTKGLVKIEEEFTLESSVRLEVQQRKTNQMIVGHRVGKDKR